MEPYNKKASKYVIMYNGVFLPVDSVEEAMSKLFNAYVEKSEDGRDWELMVNGKSQTHLISSDVDPKNGYTKEEAESYLRRHFIGRNTYSNLRWYQLVE